MCSGTAIVSAWLIGAWGQAREGAGGSDPTGRPGHLTLPNLAVLAEDRSDRAEARRLWRMVLEACPGDPEAMSRAEAWR